MKKTSCFLIVLILLQSCTVYHAPTSVEQAVATENRVKVITANDQKLKFKRLEEKNGQLIGVTKQNSSTAKKLFGMPGVTEGKFREIDLSQVEMEKIRVRNKTGSALLTTATVIFSTLAALYALAIVTIVPLFTY